MAHVMVPFVNGKGGVGKTTLACSYAVAKATEGVDVILADVNEAQHTASAWAQVREHNSLLPKLRVESGNLRLALELVGRCDLLVVDTPGWTDKGTLALARKATFMVIPTGPNPTFDLAQTVRLLHGLRAEGIETWRTGVAFSRFSAEEKSRQEEDEFARAYLNEAGYDALPGCLRNTPTYSSALAEGHGLSEVGGGRLHDEATQMMASIADGVTSAEKRLQRLNKQTRTKDRDRGGRDR